VSLRSAGCIVAFALSLLGGPLVADAQLSTKVYRIGWLGQGGASGPILPPSELTPIRIAVRRCSAAR
jgi:hypothetical protein